MNLNGCLNTVSAVDGTALHVAWYGDAARPPVLLLHGGGQTSWSWERTARELAVQDYYCLCPDLRGHGRSGRAGDAGYRLEDFAGDVSHLASQVCPTPPVAVGASLGGISSLLAQARDGQLKALVLVDIVPDWNDAGVKRVMSFMRGHAEGFATLDEAAAAVRRYQPHREVSDERVSGLKKNLREGDGGRYYWHWEPRLMELDAAAVDRWRQEIKDACSQISIPTLLISGGRSDVVDQAGADAMLALIPGAKHVEIENAHHMVAGDSNEPFTAAVHEFLLEVAPGNPPSEEDDPLCLVS